MFTQYQLEMYAKKFLKDTYNMQLTVPIVLNGRLKVACGRFVFTRYRDYSKPDQPKKIDMNKTFVENNEATTVLDVLRHELVHYALFMQGKPHDDYHPVFERELKRLGVVSQDTIDKKYQIKGKYQVYLCSNCKYQHKVSRRLKNNGLYHKCKCGGKLIDMGKRIV